MTVKLLSEQHLELLSLKEDAHASYSLHMSKYHIAVNHMSRLIFYHHMLYDPMQNV